MDVATVIVNYRTPAATIEAVSALWGDCPPPSAHKVLQGHVSTLRKALGANAIETRPPGYLLRAAGTDLAAGQALPYKALARRRPVNPRTAA